LAADGRSQQARHPRQPDIKNDICDHHPQIVRAAVELGREILGHNRTNSVWLDQLNSEEERQTIARTSCALPR
jgi:hypothetical protein